LLSYGIDPVDLWRRAATYVDRLLRGEKPGDLPVQLPTKFEMVVNLFQSCAAFLVKAFATRTLQFCDTNASMRHQFR
jgi:putative ABC transport system substrate-binding protein